jgi:polysaccharide biosynthesis protein PslG
MRKFRSLAGAQLALLVLSLATASASRAQRPMDVGVGVHMGNYPLAATQAALDALDIGFRGDVPWKDIELTPGNLQYPTSSSPLKNLDTLVTHSAQRRYEPILILAYGNKAYDGGGLITSPQGIAAFANYAAFTVTHFKGRVTNFEVWNEWNHGLGSLPGQKINGDAGQYVNLLRASFQRIKSANPQARVIAGAVSGLDTAWITQFIAAGGLNYMDGISVHPYVQCNAPAAPQSPQNLNVSGGLHIPAPSGRVPGAAQTALNFTPIGGTPEQAIAWLDQLKSLLDRSSPSRPIHVYVTEIGWPTSTGQCGVIPAKAAAYLQRFMLLAAARPWIAGVWWYDLFDDGDDPGNREDRFGLAALDHSPKPAYPALSEIGDLLKSSQTPTQTIGTHTEIVIAGANPAGKEYSAAWLPIDSLASTEATSLGAQLESRGFAARTAGLAVDPSRLGATPLIMVQP